MKTLREIEGSAAVEKAIAIVWSNKYAGWQQIVHNLQGMGVLLSGTEHWQMVYDAQMLANGRLLAEKGESE